MTELPSSPIIQALRTGPPPDLPYAGMIDTLRTFLDALAEARPDDETSLALAGDLRDWTDRLAPHAAAETARMFGRIHGVPGHGQVMCPAFAIDAADAGSLAGRVTFGSYFDGANRAAHGGAISLLFDEVLGIPGNAGVATMARTAYLHVNYRSITPIGREVQVTARVVSVEGRKRLVRGELRDGGRLCADAEALFVALRAGQP